MAHLDSPEIDGMQLAMIVSRDDFRDMLECAIEEGESRPIRRFLARRRLRNERVLERTYQNVMADAPQQAFWTEDGKFDVKALFEWLLENLPKILALIAMF